MSRIELNNEVHHCVLMLDVSDVTCLSLDVFYASLKRFWFVFFLSLHWINDLPGALRQVRLNLQVQVEHLSTFNTGN